MIRYIDLPTALPFSPQAMLGTLDGSPAWSNGHVIFKGECPSSDVMTDPPDFAKAIERADPDPMPEVHPIAVTAHGDRFYVWFSDGETAIDHHYFKMAVERWPAAQFFSDGLHQVRIEELGKRVGLICRILSPRDSTLGVPVPEAVKTLLESMGLLRAETPVQRETEKS